MLAQVTMNVDIFQAIFRNSRWLSHSDYFAKNLKMFHTFHTFHRKGKKGIESKWACPHVVSSRNPRDMRVTPLPGNLPTKAKHAPRPSPVILTSRQLIGKLTT